MAKVSNNSVKPLVINRVSFKANNIFAEHWKGSYAVYSYGHHFPLFVFLNGVWYENNDKYSVTTTRHKNQTRPNVGTVPSNTVELRKMIGLL